MIYLKVPSLILLIFFASFQRVQASENDGVVIETQQINNDLYWLRSSTSMGNTTSVVFQNNGQALLIDPNFANSAEAIKSALEKLNINKITHLSSSHFHADHVEQWAEFNKEAHAYSTPEQVAILQEMGALKNSDPLTIIESSFDLKIGEKTVQIFRPFKKIGHTNGDLIFYFKDAKALYVGDYLFVDRLPVIDSGLGNLKGYLQNIQFILSRFPADTLIIPGHSTFAPIAMRTFNLEDYKVWFTNIKQSIDFIKNHPEAEALPDTLQYLLANPRFVSLERWKLSVKNMDD